MKKILKVVMILATLAIFAACMPGGGAPGGSVFIDGVQVGGEGMTTAPAAPGEVPPLQAPPDGQAPPAGGMGDMFTLLLPFLLMFVVMYFLIIRPQRRQAKATRQMQEELRVGENVITTSGFYGKIVGVGTDAFLVEFGEGRGFKVWVRKSDIAGIKSPVMTPPPKAGEEPKEIEDRGKDKDKGRDKKDKDRDKDKDRR